MIAAVVLQALYDYDLMTRFSNAIRKVFETIFY